MRELDLHGHFLDDAIDAIIDHIEECVALGETEIYVIHGYAHGDVIKRWIWSPQFAAALRKIHVKMLRRTLLSRNDGATQILFGEIEPREMMLIPKARR